MKIIILGAGQVGGTLAATLSSENIDITLVDVDQARLNELRDRLDIQTVTGMASHPDVLARAGAEDADILIAVTNSDEVNMVACQVCYTRFRTPQKIARIRATSYLDRTEQLFNDEHIPIDVLIHPEQLVTDHIARLIAHPGALQVLDFAHGRIELVAVRASEGGPLVDQELRFLRRHIPDVDTKVAAIFRKGRALLPRDDTVVEKDDEVFFIAARKHIDKVMRELQRAERAYKRIIIAGGGNIGLRLAQTLEQRLSVKIIERSPRRCAHLSETLQRAVVLQGSSTDRELLLSENIENTDVFCALTNDDEANIMSSLLAKRLGVRRVMTLINKPAYVDLVQDGQIDIAISPQQTTVSGLLTHVRRADIVMDHTLRRGAAEAIEAIAHGDPGTSRVVGRTIGEIRLPLGATIGAIARGEKVLIGHDDVRIEPDDHVILFLTDRRKLPAVEKLFQVGLTFF
jgi:trk system potassium uptake protein TrkA